MKMAIQAVLFDADGVIVNAELFSKQYEKDFGVPAENLLPFFKGIFQDCLVGKADLKKEIAPYLSDWKWEKSIDELLKYWFEAEHKIDEKLVTYISNLRQKNIVCCLATNQEKHRTLYMLNEMGFADVFDHVFSSAVVGHRKPQVEFFQHCIDSLKIAPQEIMFWDDTPGHISVAKRMGMHAFLYESFDKFESRMRVFGL